jgi:hypothetical protein
MRHAVSRVQSLVQVGACFRYRVLLRGARRLSGGKAGIYR